MEGGSAEADMAVVGWEVVGKAAAHREAVGKAAAAGAAALKVVGAAEAVPAALAAEERRGLSRPRKGGFGQARCRRLST